MFLIWQREQGESHSVLKSGRESVEEDERLRVAATESPINAEARIQVV
jgi:head-tail adaptor